jgi:archaellum biogenesis protein FlaJ (TadC family)
MAGEEVPQYIYMENQAIIPEMADEYLKNIYTANLFQPVY